MAEGKSKEDREIWDGKQIRRYEMVKRRIEEILGTRLRN
jgi:hypothetical protein